METQRYAALRDPSTNVGVDFGQLTQMTHYAIDNGFASCECGHTYDDVYDVAIHAVVVTEDCVFLCPQGLVRAVMADAAFDVVYDDVPFDELAGEILWEADWYATRPAARFTS